MTAAFLDGGKSVSLGGIDTAAYLCNTSNGAKTRVLSHVGWVNAIAVVGRARGLLTACCEMTRLNDLTSASGAGLEPYRPHPIGSQMINSGQVWAVAVDPGERMIATGGESGEAGEVRLWSNGGVR